MWIFLALLAGVLFTGQGLITRYVLKNNKDAWAFSLIFSAVGSIITLPLALADWRAPSDPKTWLLVVVIALIIVGHNLLAFHSARYIEASLGGVIGKLRLVWVFLFGAIFLGQPATAKTFTGLVLSIAAAVIITRHFKKPESIKGIALVAASSVLNAALIIIFAVLIDSFSIASFTFFVSFFAPAIANFILMPDATRRAKKIIQMQSKPILLACALGAFANLALNAGIEQAENTSALLIVLESFLVLTLVGEHIFLKEKDKVYIKILTITLAIASAALMITT